MPFVVKAIPVIPGLIKWKPRTSAQRNAQRKARAKTERQRRKLNQEAEYAAWRVEFAEMTPEKDRAPVADQRPRSKPPDDWYSRTYRLRSSGYTGRIDQDGYAVDIPDPRPADVPPPGSRRPVVPPGSASPRAASTERPRRAGVCGARTEDGGRCKRTGQCPYHGRAA